MKLYDVFGAEAREIIGKCWGALENGKEYTDGDLDKIAEALTDYLLTHGIENDEENDVGVVCVNALNAMADL